MARGTAVKETQSGRKKELERKNNLSVAPGSEKGKKKGKKPRVKKGDSCMATDAEISSTQRKKRFLPFFWRGQALRVRVAQTNQKGSSGKGEKTERGSDFNME